MKTMNTKNTDTRGEVDMRENIIRKIGHMRTAIKAGLTFILILAGMFLNLQEAKAFTLNISSSQTWTAPGTSVTVECWGGGGGGASSVVTKAGGGGGGGGAYSKATYTVVSGTGYTVSIGAGGAGGSSAAANPGQPGGDTYFNNPSAVMAKGGTGGQPSNGAGGTGGASGSGFAVGINPVKWSGGAGATGANTLGGGGGSSAGTGADGTTATTGTGATAPAGGGNGGNGMSNAAGLPGSIPGGGGGGAEFLAAVAGGDGAAGKVVLTYALPTTTTVTEGSDPSSVTVCPGATNQPVDAFVLNEIDGLDYSIVSSVTISFNRYQNVQTVYIKSDDGGTTYGSITPASNSQALTLSTPITVNASASIPFKIYADIASGATGTLGARITDFTVTSGKGTRNDTGSATLTMNTTPPALINDINTATGDGQVSINWTNPSDSDLTNGQVMIRRKEGSYPTGYTDGLLSYNDVAPVPGAASNHLDIPLTNFTTYYYAIYSKDVCGNWNNTTTPGSNALTGQPLPFCARSQPTMDISPMGQKIQADAGTATYTLVITNNDSVTCGSSIFTLSSSDTNTADFNATTFSQGSADLAANGGSATVSVYVNAKADKTIGTTGTTVTAANADHLDQHTAFVVYTEIEVAGADSLLHNSDSTLSSYWSPTGWGVVGGKYGAIVCATCHVKSAPNIKSVKATITAPTRTTWASNGTYTVTAAFRSTSTPSGFGDDAGGHANSSKICEVCHSQTKYHRLNTATQTGGLTHYNTQDCIKCHKHSVGFRPDCDSCHGKPPTENTLGGPYGKANDPAPTGSSTVGAHSEHVSNLGYDCNACHNGYQPTMGEAQPKIDIGFNMFGRNGNGTTYDGSTEVTYTYRARNSTTVSLNGARTCSALYCHGATLTMGTYTNPAWTATGSVVCGTCHGTRASNTPVTGSHVRHAGTAAGGLGIACNDCHGNIVTGHVNGNVAWVLHTSNVRFGTNATYKSLATGSTGTFAGIGSYGACNNIYCHSSVQANGGSGAPASYGTPTWGGGGTCAACHSALPLTGRHGKHVGSMGYSDCTTFCHTNGGEGTQQHANGTINVAINHAYGASASYSQGNNLPQDGYGTCSSIYCHGNFVGGKNMTPSWATTAMNCGDCHNATQSSPPTNGTHVRHVGTNGASQLGLTCNKCHGTNGAGQTGHQDESVQWQLATSDPRLGTNAKYRGLATGSTGTLAPSASYGTCGTVYCHSNVQNATGTGVFNSSSTPTWNVGTVSCGSCHANPNTTGSHTRHNNAYGNDCSVCHTGGGLDTPNHANSRIDIGFNSTKTGTAVYSQGTHTPGSGGFGYCTTTYCHGTITSNLSATMNWGAAGITAYDNCTICHGIPTTANDGTADEYKRGPGANGTGVNTAGVSTAGNKSVGAHFAHSGTGIRSLAGYAAAMECSNCHRVPASITTAGHNDSALPAEVTFINSNLASVGGATPSYNYTTGQCTNVYCHGAKMPGGSAPAISAATVTWNDISYLNSIPTTTGNGDCDKCHFSPPSTAVHTSTWIITKCSECHTNMNTDGTFNDASKHVNGAVEASCTTCHGGATGSRRGLSAEIANTAWGHRKAAAGGWTKYDCGVCHMEGNPQTGEKDGSYHQNGRLEFRDPDNGATIQGVTFTAASGTNNPGYYTSGATISASVFARNTGTFGLEPFAVAIQINLCLKCHDANGAASTLAWANGALSGTRPFSSPSGTALNMNTHFTTTNASYHPVLGKQNNGYANANTMVTPWNMTKTAGTTTQWGRLMTCWDCHDSSSTARTIGGALAAVTSHGDAVTLRAGLSQRTAPGHDPLCVVCHTQSVYWGTYQHSARSIGGTNYSALDDLQSTSWETYHAVTVNEMRGCTSCHGAGLWSAAPTQRAESAHGSNTNAAGATTWAAMTNSGTFVGQATRPYAFIRNTNNMTGWNIGSAPLLSPSNYYGACTGMCGSRGPYYYGPTGTY